MEAIILVGIPTSGKSTFANRLEKEQGYFILSRDRIRYQLFGKKYKQNGRDEDFVTEVFDTLLDLFITNKEKIILDNTHCREKYLNSAIRAFDYTNYHVTVKFFDCGVYKALWRNLIRYIKRGIWIPIPVIERMKTNYDKINKTKYAICEYEFD